MADGPSIAQPPGTEALGKALWLPPDFVAERARRARKARLRAANWLIPIALAFATASFLATGFEPTFRAALGLAAVAAGLIFFWGVREAYAAEDIKLGVFERVVLMPASLVSAPGLQKLGRPVGLAVARIKRFEDMRRPEGRAVIVWTGPGVGGVVSDRIGDVHLSEEEQTPLLDEFIAALRQLGIGERAKDDDSPA